MPNPASLIPPYDVRIRDENRIKRGDIGRATSLKLIPRYLDVGAFELVLPLADPKAPLLVKGGWLQFFSGDEEILSGQIRGRKIVNDESNVGGTLTVYGPSAEQVVADRLAFQVPTMAATSQSATDYDRRSGAAETVVKGYVGANAGPGTIVSRRVSGLVIETDLARGASVKGSARMTNLVELIAPLCLSGGIGWRVRFNGDNLEFQVYVPSDKSGKAKFGSDLGNLVSYEQTEEAAKTNTAIVGGQGDGTLRVFREIQDSAAVAEWSNRTESFVDRRDSTDTVELDQAGTEETVTNGPVNGLAIKTADTPNLLFYRDYFLGDKVSIPEASIVDILREIEINWTADGGPSAETTVGSASTTGTMKMIQQLDKLTAQVEALQAKQ